MPKSRFIVTGASGSMGAAAVRELASRGCAVVMACRNLEKGERIRQNILKDCPDAELELRQVNLASLDSVRAFAQGVLQDGKPLDGLFNNAGTLNRDYKLSEDGYEECVAVNCLAPALLCSLLAPAMPDGGHIVNMVSLTCKYARVDGDFFKKSEKEYSQLGTYAMSKRGLMLFSINFAKENPRLRVNVADPGVVNSNMISMGRWFDPLADIFFRPLCKSPEKGVAPAMRAIQSDETLKLFIGSKTREIPCTYLNDANTAWLVEEIGRITAPRK